MHPAIAWCGLGLPGVARAGETPNLLLEHEPRQLYAGTDSGLAERLPQVEVDRVTREVHALRDFAVGEAARDVFGDTALGVGEALPPAYRLLLSVAERASRARAASRSSADLFVFGQCAGKRAATRFALAARKQHLGGVLPGRGPVPGTRVREGAAVEEVGILFEQTARVEGGGDERAERRVVSREQTRGACDGSRALTSASARRATRTSQGAALGSSTNRRVLRCASS